jgi:hypothetical protein
MLPKKEPRRFSQTQYVEFGVQSEVDVGYVSAAGRGAVTQC